MVQQYTKAAGLQARAGSVGHGFHPLVPSSKNANSRNLVITAFFISGAASTRPPFAIEQAAGETKRVRQS